MFRGIQGCVWEGFREVFRSKKNYKKPTPGSMNSLFSDLFKEFWRGILGGVRDYLGDVLGGF